MRKIVLTLAVAGAALVAASPAAAQYYPAPSQPGPAYGYGQGTWGEARSLQVRIDNIERQVNWLERRSQINDWRAGRLRDESHRLEQRLRYAARGGLNPYEARDIRFAVDRLEQQVRYSASDDRGERHARWDRDDRRDRD
jgi:hypothetical protein